MYFEAAGLLSLFVGFRWIENIAGGKSHTRDSTSFTLEIWVYICIVFLGPQLFSLRAGFEAFGGY